MKILVTAGPTREYLDAVRFLSSPSTGSMGFACARAARRRGHRVILITGPVSLKPPKGVKTLTVESAQEMYRKVKQVYPGIDAVLMAAAVADYRPAHPIAEKSKKSGKDRSLRLLPNPDILKELGRRKGSRVLIGFALEVQNARRNAMAKLRAKNLDYIVLNSPSSFGAPRVSAIVFSRKGPVENLRHVSKNDLAKKLVVLIEETRTLSTRR